MKSVYWNLNCYLLNELQGEIIALTNHNWLDKRCSGSLSAFQCQNVLLMAFTLRRVTRSARVTRSRGQHTSSANPKFLFTLTNFNRPVRHSVALLFQLLSSAINYSSDLGKILRSGSPIRVFKKQSISLNEKELNDDKKHIKLS